MAKKIEVMITAFRDGFQSAYGARVFTNDFMPAVEAARDAGIRHFEAGGGARYQSLYFYSNVPRNYGSKLDPADTLEDFPGLSTVYLRVPWAFVEPVEGHYNWAILDTPAQRWIAKGKRIALRLTCSENWMKYATPEWVKNAGAKGTFYQYGQGPVDESNSWDPFFDDPVFLKTEVSPDRVK